MTRLIDADELKKEFPHNSDWMYPVNTNEYVCYVIDAQPTVDAVPVIRCKDCKWWNGGKQECIEWYDSPYAPVDGYCFRAERKEE